METIGKNPKSVKMIIDHYSSPMIRNVPKAQESETMKMTPKSAKNAKKMP